MVSASDLTHCQLVEALSYDAETGVFTWRERPLIAFADEHHGRIWNIRFAGKPAGAVGVAGYVYISLGKFRYRAHRLAWLYVHGEWPKGEIDHANHDRADNRLANLEAATPTQNRRNQTIRKSNRFGITGVTWCENDQVWKPNITVNYRMINLGRERDFFEACCIRKSAEVRYGFHENHGKRAA